MSRQEPIFRITDIEQRARARYDTAINSFDLQRALTLGRWLVKLNRIENRMTIQHIGTAA